MLGDRRHQRVLRGGGLPIHCVVQLPRQEDGVQSHQQLPELVLARPCDHIPNGNCVQYKHSFNLRLRLVSKCTSCCYHVCDSQH